MGYVTGLDGVLARLLLEDVELEVSPALDVLEDGLAGGRRVPEAALQLPDLLLQPLHLLAVLALLVLAVLVHRLPLALHQLKSGPRANMTSFLKIDVKYVV